MQGEGRRLTLCYLVLCLLSAKQGVRTCGDLGCHKCVFVVAYVFEAVGIMGSGTCTFVPYVLRAELRTSSHSDFKCNLTAS